MNKRIMITGVGGPAGVSVIQELQRAGMYDIVASDMDPNAAGLYVVPAAQRFLVPAGAADSFVPRVIELCRTQRVDVLIPTVDSELIPLAKCKTELAAAGTTLAAADLSTFEMTLDKWQLMKACTDVAPETQLLDASWDFARAISFPRFAKPRTGSGGRGAVTLETMKDLLALPRDGSMLVQELLPGEEFSVDVYANRKGVVVAAVPRVRMKVDSGVAVTARTVHDGDLIASAVRVAMAIKLWGVANIQFRRDVSGNAKLLEVNPRFPGSLPLTAQAGPQLAQLFVREALGEVIADEHLPFREVGMVRTWQEHFMPVAELLQLRR
jgi:carbamoyl-phosphate synthase large subunit